MGKAPVRVLITGAAGENERRAAGKSVKYSMLNGLCSSQPPPKLSSVALAGPIGPKVTQCLYGLAAWSNKVKTSV